MSVSGKRSNAQRLTSNAEFQRSVVTGVSPANCIAFSRHGRRYKKESR
jgi:hypothetical protein